jgi:hypothetical protein
MKNGSFDARVARCIDQLREVEVRAQDRRHRLGLDSRVPNAARAELPPKD